MTAMILLIDPNTK